MRLTPDYLFDSYREITPDFLHRQGIALLLTDLDYTLAPKAVRRPNEALKSWIAELQGAGITVMIVSNNRSGARVTEFCADLGIGYQGHAGKPSPRGCHEKNRDRPGAYRHAGGQAADRYAGGPSGGSHSPDGGAVGRPGGSMEPCPAPASASL